MTTAPRVLFKWRDEEEQAKKSPSKAKSPFPDWEERFAKEDENIFWKVGSTKRMGARYHKYYEYPATSAFRELFIFPDYPEHNFALRMQDGTIMLELWKPGAMRPEEGTYTGNDRTIREILASIDQAIFDKGGK